MNSKISCVANMNNTNQLIKGIKYHKKKEEEWKSKAGKDFFEASMEKRILKGNKRPGRIDIYLEDVFMIIKEMLYSCFAFYFFFNV